MSLDIGALRDWLAESVLENGPSFINIGVDCKSAEDAESLASLLNGEFDPSSVQVSRGGVHALQLVAETGSTSVILSWQGEKPQDSDVSEDEGSEE